MSPTLLLLPALGIGPPGTEEDSDWDGELKLSDSQASNSGVDEDTYKRPLGKRRGAGHRE